MNIQEFITENHITMTSENWFDNPNMVNDGWKANHYKVKLVRTRPDGKKTTYTTYFSQGLGIKTDPTVEDVLDCLAIEAGCVLNEQTFEDFCFELGYDEDSRKAEKVYKTIQRQTRHLERLLGSKAALHDLVFRVERL